MYIFNLADLNGVTSDKIINNRNNIYSHEFIICYVDYYKKNIQIIWIYIKLKVFKKYRIVGLQ